jgi:hypothetical protein
MATAGPLPVFNRREQLVPLSNSDDALAGAGYASRWMGRD